MLVMKLILVTFKMIRFLYKLVFLYERSALRCTLETTASDINSVRELAKLGEKRKNCD